MANCDSFLRDKFKLKGYPNKSQALSDAKTALEQYKTLKPIFKNCSLPDGHNKELLCLDGTIPVNYRGSTYNIPISIWLQEKHPYIAPFAHVVPTAEMEIKPGRHVDAHGRVYLPFLTEWKYPQSDLYSLIQMLRLIFAEQPPVFARRSAHTYPRYQPSSYPNNPLPGMPQAASELSRDTQSSFEISPDMLKASLKSGVQDNIRRRLNEDLARNQAEMEPLQKKQRDLTEERRKLQNMMQKIEAEEAEVSKDIEILTQKNKEIEETIAILQQ